MSTNIIKKNLIGLDNIMPEGPETKRMADSLSKAIKKKKIVSAQFLYPTIHNLK